MSEIQPTWTSMHGVPRAFLLRWCAWFFLGAGAVFALIALRYFAVAPAQLGWMPIVFTVLMIVSQSTVLALVAFVPVAPLILLLPRPRVVLAVSVLVALVLLLLGFVDTFVYQQYRFHMDASVWGMVTGGAGDETFVFATRTYVKLALVVVLLLLVLIGLARVAWWWTNTCAPRRRGLVLGGVLALVVLSHHGFYAWADAAGYVPILRQSRILPLHRPLTAKRAMRSLGVHVARAQFTPNDTGSGLEYPRAPLRCTPPAQKLNLLFIVIDSWRADAESERATPNLSMLAAESQRFEDHYSGGNATRVGMFSLFYGIPGTYWHDVLGERRGPVLVEECLRGGYDVVAFCSAPLYSPEFDNTIFSDVSGLRTTTQGNTPAERDRVLTEDFLEWLANRDETRPFLALVFYDSPHAYDFPADWPLTFQPSLPVVDYMTFDNATDPEPFKNRYLNSVRYADSLAGRVVEGVRARGLIESTVVLATGDHGQEFNELKQNYWGHNSNFARFQTRVPLIVRWPGRAPRAFAYRTSHFDVVPTIVGRVLGCENPVDDYAVGLDLFDASDRGVLTLSSYGDCAGVQPDGRCVVVTSMGDVDVLDSDYRPASMTDPDRAALESTIKQRSWFRPRAAQQK